MNEDDPRQIADERRTELEAEYNRRQADAGRVEWKISTGKLAEMPTRPPGRPSRLLTEVAQRLKRYIQVGRFEEGFDNTTLRLWLQPGSVYTHKPGHQITTERDCTLQGHLGREDGPAVDKDATAARAHAASRPSLASLDEATAQKLRETSVADLLETEAARLVEYDRLNDLFASGKAGQFSRAEGWDGASGSMYSDGDDEDDDGGNGTDEEYSDEESSAGAARGGGGGGRGSGGSRSGSGGGTGPVDHDLGGIGQMDISARANVPSESNNSINDSIEAAENIASEDDDDDGVETDISRTPSPGSSRGSSRASSRRSGGSRSTSVTAFGDDEDDDDDDGGGGLHGDRGAAANAEDGVNATITLLTAEQTRRAKARPVKTLGRTVHEIYGPQITLPRSLLPPKEKESVLNLFEVASELIAAKEDRLSVSASVTTSQGPASYPVRGKPRLRTKQRPHSPPPAQKVKTYLHTPSKVAPVGADAGGFSNQGNAVTSRAVGQGPYPPWVYIQQPVEKVEWEAAWVALDLPEVWHYDFNLLFGQAAKDGQRASCVVHAQVVDTLTKAWLQDRVDVARVRLRRNGLGQDTKTVWTSKGRQLGEGKGVFMGVGARSRPSMVSSRDISIQRMRVHYGVGARVLSNLSPKRQQFGRVVTHVIGYDSAVFDACDVDGDGFVNSTDLYTFLRRLGVGSSTLQAGYLVQDFSDGGDALDRAAFERFLVESIAFQQLDKPAKPKGKIAVALRIIRSAGPQAALQLLDDVAEFTMRRRLANCKGKMLGTAFRQLLGRLHDYFSLENPQRHQRTVAVQRLGEHTSALLMMALDDAIAVTAEQRFVKEVFAGVGATNLWCDRVLDRVRTMFQVPHQAVDPGVLDLDDFLEGLSRLGFKFVGGTEEQDEYCALFADHSNREGGGAGGGGRVEEMIDYAKVERALLRYRAFPPPLGSDASSGQVEPGAIIRGKIMRRLTEARKEEAEKRKAVVTFSSARGREKRLSMPEAVVEQRMAENEAAREEASRVVADLEVVAEGVFGNEPELSELMVEAGELVLERAGLLNGSMADVLRSAREHCDVKDMKPRPSQIPDDEWCETSAVKSREACSDAKLAGLLTWTGQQLPGSVIDMFVNYLNPYQESKSAYGAVERYLLQVKLQSDEWMDASGHKIVAAAANHVMDFDAREDAYAHRRHESKENERAFRPLKDVLSEAVLAACTVGGTTTAGGSGDGEEDGDGGGAQHVTSAELIKGLKTINCKLKKRAVARLFMRLGVSKVDEGVQLDVLLDFLETCMYELKSQENLGPFDKWEADPYEVAAAQKRRAAAEAVAAAEAALVAAAAAEAAEVAAELAALGLGNVRGGGASGGGGGSGSGSGGRRGGNLRKQSSGGLGVGGFSTGPTAMQPAARRNISPRRVVRAPR